MSKRIVCTKAAPAAIGPYSQAILLEKQGLVFTAGQIPIDPSTGEIVSGSIQAQTHQVLKNIKAVLEAATSGLEHVVKATVYLKNMNDFSEMNQVYADYFPKNPPARSAVEVARLPKDVLIEIECIAEVERTTNRE